jgi:hypothetical protein
MASIAGGMAGAASVGHGRLGEHTLSVQGWGERGDGETRNMIESLFSCVISGMEDNFGQL